MPLLADPVFCWCLFAIQVVGLVCMVLARMPQSTSLHSFCRTCFLGCLVVVGLATIGTSIDCHTSCWAWCATIFAGLQRRPRKVSPVGTAYRAGRELGVFGPFGSIASPGKIEKNLPSGATG
jgi:hypothetical protein